jgi:crotonobetainyl-CoA:carnitine CoA-transferase CaiB-like acyl-CoA transferase
VSAPLEGIRVVELASFVAAPAAGALLADLGADVVKVEVPRGELYRYATPGALGIASDFPEAPQFHMDNRGKRSLALDVTRPEARDALHRLIERADVVLTNMLPERLRRYGFDAASLRRRQPALVFASLTGYGDEGPDAGRPAFDYTAYWARTGFMDLMREPDAAPAFQRPGVGDHAASLSLVAGILAALRVRDRTGEGQEVAVSLMHIGFYVQGNDAALALATGGEVPHHDRLHARNPLWNHYRTQDGRWIFLVMIDSDRYWPGLCAALGLAHLREDPRFDGMIERYRNAEALIGILAETIALRPLDAWERLLGEHDLIWAPVRTLAEAVRDPQARASGVFQPMKLESTGPFDTITPPLRLSGHAMRGDRPAPRLGADGEEVLAEAGLAPEEIARVLGASTGSADS